MGRLVKVTARGVRHKTLASARSRRGEKGKKEKKEGWNDLTKLPNGSRDVEICLKSFNSGRM